MFSDNENLKDIVCVSFDKFRQDALKRAEQRGEYMRKGQFIYIDCMSRYYKQLVELERYTPELFSKVDCFYNDNNIDTFLEAIYENINKTKYNL